MALYCDSSPYIVIETAVERKTPQLELLTELSERQLTIYSLIVNYYLLLINRQFLYNVIKNDRPYIYTQNQTNCMDQQFLSYV